MNTEGTESRRILVIDDDEVMRELLGALLKVQGYDVQVAGSGEEGLVNLQQPDPPLLLLTDLQMPGLEGEALTSALRSAAPAPALIIGMSGRRPTEAVLRPLDAFLSKPFDAATLERAFAEAQESRAAQAAGAPLHGATPPPPEPEEDPATAGDEPVLDEHIFAAFRKSFQPAQILELYTLTLDDVRERHARMQADAAEGDLEAVQREAHAVKGACGMVGARELQHLAAVVESGTTLDTSVLSEIPIACDRLRRMLDIKLQPKW